MKVLAVVAIFAFVAVQLGRSAPTPDEEKKDAPVAPAAAADNPAEPTSEVKAVTSEVNVSPSEASPHAEDKKA